MRGWPPAVVNRPPTATRFIGTDRARDQALLLRLGFQVLAIAVVVETDAARVRVVARGGGDDGGGERV